MSRKTPKLSYHGSPHKHNEDEESLLFQIKNNQNEEDNNGVYQEQLIPGLPDHIAHLILSKIPPSILYSVSHPWRNFIYSPLYPPFYSLYTILTPNDLDLNSNTVNNPSFQFQYQYQCLTPISFFNFDPISSQWEALPPPPPPLYLLLRHPPFISSDLSVQSVTVGDRLAVVAGTTQHLAPALSRPLVFDPMGQGWAYGPDIPVPRRWCVSGSLAGSLYLASGVGSQFSTDTARAVQRWNPSGREKWENLGTLWDGRFSREASDAIGWRGRLCMVNVKGVAAKQGAVYTAAKNVWSEMKEGMVNGWRGPTAAMDETVVYTVDEFKGVVRMYDEEKDVWVNVFESERLIGARQMAARAGRVCVVCKGGGEIVVVDVVAAPPRMWVVEPPEGFSVAAVHVLPRISRVHL